MSVDSKEAGEMGTTETMTRQTLKVPGATLYYEVRGTGPVLLLMSGGPTDADIYGGLARALADRYTVVTYDPRGNSRSVLDSSPQDWSGEVQADDAARVIEAVSKERSAYVFGNSSGALVGLALAARDPQKVRTLVAHEPPATALLPDAELHRAHSQQVYETYRAKGIGPAMQQFMAFAGLQAPAQAGPDAPRRPENGEAMARMGRNMELFLAHGLREVGAFVPDVAALRAGSPHIVVAGGDASQGQLAHRCAVALAERLGTDVVVFPGDHGGFMTQPDAFAARLHDVLAKQGSVSVR
jgi:pimeloyl-ACP methyl ester carboxylesterase